MTQLRKAVLTGCLLKTFYIDLDEADSAVSRKIVQPAYGHLDGLVGCRNRSIGRIYQTRTGPESLRWFWALHAPSKPGSMRISNQVATLDEAKAEFEASWKQWKAWAGMEETG